MGKGTGKQNPAFIFLLQRINFFFQRVGHTIELGRQLAKFIVAARRGPAVQRPGGNPAAGDRNGPQLPRHQQGHAAAQDHRRQQDLQQQLILPQLHGGHLGNVADGAHITESVGQ